MTKMHMTHRKYLLVLLPLLLVSLSCQAVTGLLPASATPIPSETPTVTSTLTPIPDTATPTITLTPIPPTETPEPTATLMALSAAERLEIFQQLWTVINDNYIYADFNGVDWNAVRDEYHQKVLLADDSEEYYYQLSEMVYILGDDHSAFLNPREVLEQEIEFSGQNNFVGIGILTQAVFERGYATVLLTFPDSPAEKAGIKPHDNILSADGVPVIQGEELKIDMLRGPEGSKVEVEVQTPGEEPRQVTITRKRFQDATPVPYEVFTTPEGKRIGYIMVVTFADITIDMQMTAALEEMSADGALDGIIIDNRVNSGGADVVAKGALGLFTKGIMGYFSDRYGQRRRFEVEASDVNGSQDIPLVVLVGKGTVSFGELFAGVLKDNGRAYIVGETTDGNVELLRGFDFEDGSRAWIAFEKFRPLYHPDDDWEKNGIVPDLTVLSEWDLVTNETDPVILSALEYFDSN